MEDIKKIALAYIEARDKESEFKKEKNALGAVLKESVATEKFVDDDLTAGLSKSKRVIDTKKVQELMDTLMEQELPFDVEYKTIDFEQTLFNIVDSYEVGSLEDYYTEKQGSLNVKLVTKKGE